MIVLKKSLMKYTTTDTKKERIMIMKVYAGKKFNKVLQLEDLEESITDVLGYEEAWKALIALIPDETLYRAFQKIAEDNDI